jgi:branched-chain amino acid transport system ATP-binding protein
MSGILKLTNVSKSFGALKVIDSISFIVHAGETYGIVGPNGAGKTSLFNLISGDLRADAGSIVLNGHEISALAPHMRCIAGIGRSYQIPRPFSGMTVFENLLVAASFGGQLSEHAAYDLCGDVIERSGLEAHANDLAGTLTLLDRKRLELARALSTRPALLLLDEIAGGLTEPETYALIEQVQRVKKQGVTILWIEHVVRALLAVADRVLVIHSGKRLVEGLPADAMADPEVKRVYMGIEA